MQDAPCPDLPDPSTEPGMWFWGLLFVAVLAYEIWAVATKRLTLTQTVQRGPRWFKWAMFGGLAALILHLFTRMV